MAKKQITYSTMQLKSRGIRHKKAPETELFFEQRACRKKFFVQDGKAAEKEETNFLPLR